MDHNIYLGFMIHMVHRFSLGLTNWMAHIIFLGFNENWLAIFFWVSKTTWLTQILFGSQTKNGLHNSFLDFIIYLVLKVSSALDPVISFHISLFINLFRNFDLFFQYSGILSLYVACLIRNNFFPDV